MDRQNGQARQNKRGCRLSEVTHDSDDSNRFTIIGYVFTQAEMLSGAKIFISIIGLLVCIFAILILNEKIIRKIEEIEEP